MKEKGYLPFTTIGIILLLLAAVTFSYYEWDRHQTSIKSINQSGSSQISTNTISKRTDLKNQVGKTLNNSLWKVGKSTENFGSKKSEIRRIEQISENNLKKKLTPLSDQINLKPNKSVHELDFEVENSKEGRPIARVSFPKGMHIRGKTPDNSTMIKIPVENLKTMTTPRFFLLQNRMKKFGEDLNNIERRWKYFEYALAYSQAWLTGKLKFDEKRSEALFQLALATHEINKFGSTDYQAILRDLTNISFSEIKLPSQIESKAIKDPLNEKKIQNISQKMKKSIISLKASENQFQKTEDKIKKVAEFQPEKILSKKLKKISELEENEKNLQNKFVKICNETESTYDFPNRQLDKSLKLIRKSENLLKESRDQFRKGLESIKSSKQNNPPMKQLYGDFTQEGTPGGIAPQLEKGYNSVLENLKSLEKRILQIQKTLPKSEDYKKQFPGDLREKFSQKLEENKKVTQELLSEAYSRANETFTKYEKCYESSKREINQLDSRISKEVERQTRRPDPNWSETYTKYPSPGEEDKKTSEEKNAEKFVIFQNQGTFGGISRVLSGAKDHLERIEELNEKFEKERNELENFKIDKDLRRVLKEGNDFQLVSTLSREESFELSPPKPLKPDPNLSVYHEVEIESVNFDRLDPLGLAYKSAPPTPIYLWFIDTIIYWGLWDVKIEIKKPIVEEIFDYPNQMIPRPITKDSNQYVHKPLPYKQKFQKTEFEFKLLVLSLRKFSISY